jgi:hypothetical protein
MKKKITLTVSLTTEQIDTSLENAKEGLVKYLAIQKRLNDLAGKPLKNNSDFRKSFNGFYRIRQKPAVWYDAFYELLDESRSQPVDFPTTLRSLYEATDRYEASFASKLVATLNPHMPVIDSIVLKNLNTRLPYQNDPDRFDTICALHEEINRCYSEYLQSEQGKYLVSQFQNAYPNAEVTEVKMLDLVLWQSR